MRRYFSVFLLIISMLMQKGFADSAPVSCSDNFLFLQVEDKKTKNIEKQEKPVYYISKEKDIENDKGINLKSEKKSKKEENRKEENRKEEKIKDSKKQIDVDIKDSNDRVLFESTRRINAIYPLDATTNSFPGYRGTNQLVIYLRDFGRTTGTNEFGKEAIIQDGVVVALTGANSHIPRDGYVVSGHGTAKKWITENLKVGTKIEIQDRTIRAYTTIDSYRYQAKEKIDEVQNILISSKSEYSSRDDKFIYYYLKKAKQQYKKSKKDSSDASLACAKEAIKNATLAFRYTLPYLKNELKGIWLRPTETTYQEIQTTLDKIKENGIDNIFLETYFHGMTIFPSRVMEEYGFEKQNPKYKNNDILAIWIKEAHKRKIKVHCWFESFYVGNKPPEMYEKSILAKRPEWQNRNRQKADYEGYVSHPQEHNGYFLDPANPEVTGFLLSLIGEITSRYNIDGINIDYVRYPNVSKENYSNQWGYTPYARQEFMQIFETDPIDITPKTEMWENWNDYRRNKITEYVRKTSELVKNRNILLSAVIFPDYKLSLQTKQQDWELWLERNYFDAITPLILTGDDELAKSMLEEVKKKASSNTLIYPGLFAGFIESDPEELLKQIHITRKLKMSGVVLFDWAHLTNEYLETLKTSVFKVQTY